TPLHVAAEAKNTEIAALLLHAGADPSAQWEQDWYQALHLAAMKEDVEMMKLLLDHGAPIDDRWGCDGCSENARHFACSKGNFEMVELLLSRGADLESHGHYGTALGFAVRRNLNIGLVKFLLNKGAKAEV
ncbi:ankyrin repeat-containing domain protein, partial [Mycena galericulata]